MDHSQAPILRALQAYHDSGQLPFTPPGHKQARGIDARVSAVMGEAVFRSGAGRWSRTVKPSTTGRCS